MTRPNIILITPHDLGDYLGCYGTPVPTPHTDSLARDGVLFRNHFSCGTVCSPSRGGIITGCYPHTNGLMGLVHRGWELDVAKCPPIMQLLSDAGYQTHLFGFQHEHYDPRRLGYGEIHGGAGNHVEEVVPLLADWLRTPQSREKPFFVGLGFSEVHRMGLNPSGFRRDIYEPADPAEVEVRPFLPDIPQIREDLSGFYGAIKLMDKMVGELLRALDETGLANNTIVLFTSDHGASFMHSKATLYDGGTKVPWIMRWPAGLPAGTLVEGLTGHIDITPTLLDLAGCPVPPWMQGQSMAAVARGVGGSTRELVFAEKNYTNFYDPSRMVRSDKIKYIRKGLQTCIFDFVIPEIEQCTSDFRRTREVWEHYSARRCTEELYDLERDPGELTNLIDDPAYAQALEQMRRALDEHLESTDDPFRRLRNELPMHPTAYEGFGSMRRKGGAHW